uniref:Uncharacterized protein n=1 Tax=Globodera rostochiensis TaxID=31243 RepID=A0A914I7R6_GLORO
MYPNIQALILIIYIARTHATTQKSTYSLRIRERTKALDVLYKITDKCAKLEEFLGDSVLYALTKMTSDPTLQKILHVNADGLYLHIFSKGERLFFLRLKEEEKKIEEVYGTPRLI